MWTEANKFISILSIASIGLQRLKEEEIVGGKPGSAAVKLCTWL